MSFSVSDVTYVYPGAENAAVDGVSLEIRAGAHTIIIGPNGAGKTTLMRLLLGRLDPSRGVVELDGRSCADWPRKAFARRVALVAQLEVGALQYTVRELVQMGRYPHMPLLGGASDRDRELVDRAIERLDLRALADRPIGTLSGGERQRTRLARALAQQPEILLLDEPSAHLDVGHQMALFDLICKLSVEQSLTVVSITHDVNLAGRFSDDLVLLAGGRLAGHGRAEVILESDLLSKVYDWPMFVAEVPGVGPMVVARREPAP